MMKIQVLIAIQDSDYMEHLSQVLSDKHAEIFEVSTCSTKEWLSQLTTEHRFDIALLDPGLAEGLDSNMVQLPLLLWDGTERVGDKASEYHRLKKYQRISALTGAMLEKYAEISPANYMLDASQGHVTVVWSPVGGSGKTSVAIAYGFQQAACGRSTVYLDLEPFSSTPACFHEAGKGISAVFGMLSGNAELMLQSIRLQDKQTGLFYFAHPDNYEDVNILTKDDISRLISACLAGADELVVDIGSSYDEKTKLLLDRANQILMVIDESKVGQEKWKQFQTQNILFDSLKEKVILIINKAERANQYKNKNQIALPVIKSNDPMTVCKALSSHRFLP